MSSSISSTVRYGMSTALTKARSRPASAAARRPRAVANNGPTPRTSSRSTSAFRPGGSGWPGAATTKTGEQRSPRIATARSTNVVSPSRPEKLRVALSRPMRRDAPPARMTAANGVATLFDGPGVFSTEQGLQSRRVVRLGIPCRADLIARHLVVRRADHLTEDAHHGVLEVLLRDARECERVGRIVDVGVVHHDVVGCGVRRLGDLEAVAGLHHAVLTVGAERDRLAVGHVDQPFVGAFLAERVERAVVEDRAVLQDLDQRSATMGGRRTQHLGKALAVRVERPADEGGLGAQRQRDRVERVVQRAQRGRLGDLADLGGRRVLPLGEPVDAVVEQQDRQIHVAAQRMDQVVAADRQRIAVTGHDPDRKVFAGQRETGRDGGRATVDRVEAVGLEVVREAARAADAADEHHVLALQAQLRQEVADGVEDDVVTAAGAPADFLVAGEVLGLLRLVRRRHRTDLRQTNRCEPEVGADHVRHAFTPTPVTPVSTVARANLALSVSLSASVPSSAASMMPSTSSARNAMPSTLVTDWMSTRYLPRSSIASWPRFISGRTTFW